MFAYVRLWAYSSVFICIGCCYIPFRTEIMSYSPWLLHCRVLCMAYYRYSSLEWMSMLVTNEYPLDVSLPCECIYILVERCFPELLSFVYLSEWVRKGQLEWEGLAEEGDLEPGSKIQQETGVNVSLTPTLHSLSAFKTGLHVFPFLLALSKFSRTVRTFLFRNQLRPISSLLWRRMRGWFHASNRSVFLPFFRLKFCFQRAGKMETEIIDSTTTSRPVKCHLCY